MNLDLFGTPSPGKSERVKGHTTPGLRAITLRTPLRWWPPSIHLREGKDEVAHGGVTQNEQH
ncbi:MAG: hypothetical protein E6J21_01265 [Chloroflexota bacterium]|nr:MAG: hypothetical protein E6J21_01265 [Chloroflexota bacterium]